MFTPRQRSGWAALLVAVLVAGQSCVPAAVSAAATFLLSGRVYQGETGVEPPQSTPLENVGLVLYGSSNEDYLGDALDEATTDRTGWYSLTVPDAPTKEFYTIVLTVPSGYAEEGCTTVDGERLSNTRIRYYYPLTGKTLTGNKFWLRGPATSTPTHTGVASLTPTGVASLTVTRTSVPPSSTPTGTNTLVPTVTPTGTRTVVPSTATATSTATGVVPTASPTGTSTATRVATATRTALFPSATPTRGRTPTPTPAP